MSEKTINKHLKAKNIKPVSDEELEQLGEFVEHRARRNALDELTGEQKKKQKIEQQTRLNRMIGTFSFMLSVGSLVFGGFTLAIAMLSLNDLFVGASFLILILGILLLGYSLDELKIDVEE